MTRPLPSNVARCPGVREWEGLEWEWRDGCEDCRRRSSPGRPDLPMLTPEAIIVFECPWRIGPDDLP